MFVVQGVSTIVGGEARPLARWLSAAHACFAAYHPME